MKKVQIIMGSCERRSLEIEQVKLFMAENDFSVIDETHVNFSHRTYFKVCKDADLILYSTCGFTSRAEDLAIENVKKILGRKRPSAQLIVCGCLPEINPARLTSVFQGEMFGPRSYDRLDTIIRPKREFRELSQTNTIRRAGSSAALRNRISKAKALLDQGGWPSLLKKARNEFGEILAKPAAKPTYYIQIQQGCPCRCSYCAIRFAIKELTSKPLDEVVAEFQRGLDQGHDVFCLMGDSIGAYGLDLGSNLGALLDRLLRFQQRYSLNLVDISPVFFHLCADSLHALCERGVLDSLYVPVQSANQRILKLMNRSCDINRVGEMLRDLKRSTHVRIGTSIIAGFPSETVPELRDTIEFCKRVGFDWVYCHSFSARPETDAARLPGQLTPEDKKERCLLVRSELHHRTLLNVDA